MSKETLYVLGNGFDLYHGLKTSYSDFGKYVEKNHSQLYYYLERYFHHVNLWSDFENALSTFDISEFFGDNERIYTQTKRVIVQGIYTLWKLQQNTQ